MTAKQNYTYISLFSGGMGLDIGLSQEGFTPLVANEIDMAAVETIRLNLPHLPVLSESIEQLTAKSLRYAANFDGEIDFIAGGPPCQSFSVYGNRKGVQDGRGKLIFEFFRIVKEARPKTFLMENVRGLHSMPLLPPSAAKNADGFEPWMTQKGSLLKKLLCCFESIGYRVDCFLVNAANYGAPQIRERLLLIGNRYNLEANFPQPTHSNKPEEGLLPFRTLRDAIGTHFCDPDPSLMNFSERKLKYLAMVPPGGNWRSLPVVIQQESMGKSWYLKGGRSATWRKLSWDFPSPTVVTMPNHASTSMCHPEELRALTLGECAAIQEFPLDWKFAGKTQEKYRQVGNAVPTRLGSIAGKCVRDLLDRINQCKEIHSYELISSKIQHLRPHVRTKRYWKNGQALAGDYEYYTPQTTQLSLLAIDKN